MNIHTHFEDLSNEIFFEIFDYLYALDVFTAFTSLNERILSILQFIRLHIIILNTHCDRDIDFLSSHLTFHAHQVLSLNCYDTIRDRSSVISLLFQRHNFINLQSCQFISVNPSTELDNVIKQVESLNRLVSLSIIQPSTVNINEKNKSDMTRTVFMSKSSSLRSVMLRSNYAYLDLSTYTSIASNLISLDLLISGSPNTVSVYSILPILRVCHRIRYLHAIIEHEIPSENNNVNVSIQEAFTNENDLPISPQVTSFDLSIFTTCDTRSIAYTLRCLPNLLHFKFLHESREKYPEWQMIIDRWGPDAENPLEYVMLRTIGYHKYKRNLQTNIPLINYELFETTTTTTNDHYLYYSDIKILKLNMTRITPKTACSFPLFQHINSLVIDMRTKHSSWDKSLSFGKNNTFVLTYIV
ncbi:unnamed protein product [Rotaria magnacalcarata]|uniref:F-box domain-containing protein n=2 Tax=Rotaria magnacalcarata TaxID=392030 RepID=A0A816F1T3_9BILA|nr:unnamed protein product [Rotaria magnacalcarata]